MRAWAAGRSLAWQGGGVVGGGEGGRPGWGGSTDVGEVQTHFTGAADSPVVSGIPEAGGPGASSSLA